MLLRWLGNRVELFNNNKRGSKSKKKLRLTNAKCMFPETELIIRNEIRDFERRSRRYPITHLHARFREEVYWFSNSTFNVNQGRLPKKIKIWQRNASLERSFFEGFISEISLQLGSAFVTIRTHLRLKFLMILDQTVVIRRS